MADSSELSVGDWVLQLSPIVAVALTVVVAILNYMVAREARKASLKDVLEKSLDEYSAFAKSLDRKFDRLLDRMLDGGGPPHGPVPRSGT